MVSVNLLPPNVRLARRRARRIRLWIGVVLTTALLATVPIGLDAAKAARAAAVDRALAPVQERLDGVRAELRQTTADCSQLTTQIARADALRAKRSWGGLLVTITHHQPDQVWLTSLASKQSTEPARARPGGKKENAKAASEDAVVALDGPRGIRLEGYALDHDWLYQFITNLKQAGLFTNVELNSAGREPMASRDVVRFVLECDW